MNFDMKFLEDEVRLGFYIPASVKQAWAAEIEILEVIDGICKQNNIKYFADWGTLLGAVRHAGFIPWDDDVDLVMLREDYDNFLKIAPSLLPKGFCVHTFRNTDNFVEFHAVVTNTESARFDEEHFTAFHGFPYIAGIDIFVLDYIYNDKELEKKRVEDVTFIIAFADGLLQGRFSESALASGFDRIDSMFDTHINRLLPAKQLWILLYELAEKKCAEVTSQDSDTITQMVPWGLKSLVNMRFSASDYDKIVYIPFEYSSIPVPLYANKMLSNRYGDYMHFVTNAGAHDYPCFDKQKKDFELLLGKKLGVCDYVPPTPREIYENWKNTVKECFCNLIDISSAIDLNDANSPNAVIDAQNLSIDLGNFIEAVKGENHPTIKSIENYCEKLYILYTESSQSALMNVAEAFDELKINIEKNIFERKEIVFLPYNKSALACMTPLIDEYRTKEEYDIFVMPIPLYYKNFDGTLSNGQIDIQSYPEGVNIVSYTNFATELHRPDIIVTSYPFDGYNPATGIDPTYYSTNLRNLCNELIYISPYQTYDFDSSDVRSYKNMETYVTSPALINSDSVYVGSDLLRKTYIEKLTDWAGIDTKAIWEDKIKVFKYARNELCEEQAKTLLYHISGTRPLEFPNLFINKIRQNISVLSSQSNQLTAILLIDETLKINLTDFNPELSEEYETLIKELTEIERISIIQTPPSQDLLDKCDAFYGDPGNIASEFIARGKPVMIQNYET